MDKNRSDNIGNLILAFSKAQNEYPEFNKNREGFYKYADLDSVMNEIRKILAKYELSFWQEEGFTADKILYLESILGHSSGEWISSATLLVPPDPNSPLTPSQEFGKRLTYQRRYSAFTLLNITILNDPDDNDGDTKVIKKTSNNNDKISSEQAANIVNKITKCKNGDKLLANIQSFNKINKLLNLPACKYESVMSYLKNNEGI
jgi:hypothetical protein